MRSLKCKCEKVIVEKEVEQKSAEQNGWYPSNKCKCKMVTTEQKTGTNLRTKISGTKLRETK